MKPRCTIRIRDFSALRFGWISSTYRNTPTTPQISNHIKTSTFSIFWPLDHSIKYSRLSQTETPPGNAHTGIRIPLSQHQSDLLSWSKSAASSTASMRPLAESEISFIKVSKPQFTTFWKGWEKLSHSALFIHIQPPRILNTKWSVESFWME